MMSRFVSIVLGPELYWLVVCALVFVKGEKSSPPDEAVTAYLDAHWAWLPFIFVPLTFACFIMPGVGRWWLLLRIDLAIAVGLVVASFFFANAMTYHKPSAGPGAGTAFMVIPILGYVMAFVGTAITALFIWLRQRA